MLRYLAKHVYLDDPEKESILFKKYSEGHKDNLVDTYNHSINYYGSTWEKPSDIRYEKIRKIPKEEEINKITTVLTLKHATAYSVIRYIGLHANLFLGKSFTLNPHCRL